MTLASWVKLWAGKGIDYDKAFGNQCVDVYRQYCKDMGMKQCPPVVGAKEITAQDGQLECSIPQVGDIIVYDATPSNKYGHVAICVGIIEDVHLVIEQNGFKPEDPSYITWRKNNSILRCIRRVESLLD